MHYKFSWDTGTKLVDFNTSCPVIGETLMNSKSDFPKRTTEIQQQFDQVYGGQRGKFEQLLRDGQTKNSFGEIQTGIRGLVVRYIDHTEAYV